MPNSLCLHVIGLVFVLTASGLGQDWPQWRGPAGVNHAAFGATAPVA